MLVSIVTSMATIKGFTKRAQAKRTLKMLDKDSSDGDDDTDKEETSSSSNWIQQ